MSNLTVREAIQNNIYTLRGNKGQYAFYRSCAALWRACNEIK